MVILFWLGTQPSIRFNELQRRIGGISYKSLTAAVRELGRGKRIIVSLSGRGDKDINTIATRDGITL